LLIDALNSTIPLSLKVRDEIDFATFDNSMEKDVNVVFELSCLASNKKKVIGVLNSFFSFLKKHEEKSFIICFLLCWSLGCLGLRPFVL
jgi:hypothetical protein